MTKSDEVLNTGAGRLTTKHTKKTKEEILMELLHREESYAVMGACFEVYKEMGCGFLEAVYQECLEMEFELQGIAFQSQPAIPLQYKQDRLLQVYQPDFICFDKILLEIKSVVGVIDVHRAQVHNYLCATGYRVGIIANFNSHPKLEWERIVR